MAYKQKSFKDLLKSIESKDNYPGIPKVGESIGWGSLKKHKITPEIRAGMISQRKAMEGFYKKLPKKPTSRPVPGKPGLVYLGNKVN
tara:strand:- start:584 stop:844 length:261 start_codon:yes stop_codon:yes gene_type:complete